MMNEIDMDSRGRVSGEDAMRNPRWRKKNVSDEKKNRNNLLEKEKFAFAPFSDFLERTGKSCVG